MNKIDINSNVKIYFLISWILGAVILFSKVTQMAAELAYILIFISLLNVFFNALVIIFFVGHVFHFQREQMAVFAFNSSSVNEFSFRNALLFNPNFNNKYSLIS